MSDPPAYAPPARLRQLPTWLVSQLARRGETLVNSGLAQEGVRRAHFTVLVSLSEQGPASQAELGRRLWIDRSDLHAILNELEAAHYVTRVRDPQDRRRNRVELTPRGAEARERLDASVQAAQDELLADLSASERTSLVRLLHKLIDD